MVSLTSGLNLVVVVTRQKQKTVKLNQLPATFCLSRKPESRFGHFVDNYMKEAKQAKEDFFFFISK